MLAAIKVKTNWRDWVKGIAVLIVASQLFVSLPESIFKSTDNPYLNRFWEN